MMTTPHFHLRNVALSAILYVSINYKPKYFSHSLVNNCVYKRGKVFEKKWMKNLDFGNCFGLYVSFYFPNFLSTIFIFSFTQFLQRFC